MMPWVEEEKDMTILLSVLVLLAVVSLGVLLLAHASVHVTLLRRRAWRDTPTPPVSILKPLKGLDDGLHENLVAMARQDYPHFEILLGAEDPEDPALAVARRVQQEHPAVRIRIVRCNRPIGLNPKVNNLVALAAEATHDLILISDSNVRPDPGYLRALVSEMADPRVGMVSSLLAGVGERSLGSLMENAHLNSFVAGGICAAHLLTDRACVVGKSMLFRKSHLNLVGGWWSVRDTLAEDYLLGQRFQQAGFRVVLSPHVLSTVNIRWPISRFASRHLRWGQLRRWLSPTAFLLENLGNPTPAMVGMAVLATQTDAVDPEVRGSLLMLALGGIFLKWLSDELLAVRLRGAGYGFRGIVAILIKDLLVPGIWVVAGLRRTVDWRGNRLWIGPGSRLSRHRPPLGDLPEPDGNAA